MPSRLKFMMDLDGVLFNFVHAAVGYLNDRFQLGLDEDNLPDYNMHAWTDNETAIESLLCQMDTARFWEKVLPYPEALEAIPLLAQYGEIVAVTARPVSVMRQTRFLLAQHFPDIREVRFSKKKSRTCRELRLTHAFDDHPGTVSDLSLNRIHVTFIKRTSCVRNVPKPKGRFVREAPDIRTAVEEFALRNPRADVPVPPAAASS